MEPYRGLQPYTEENEDIFFGRDAERAILIDKILADKLTLLFSATGVGKSSLLQAAVMPELKRPARENLDVVYYNDWVTPPLTGLKQKILTVLQKRGKIDADFQFPSQEGPEVSHSPLEEPVLSEVEGGQRGVFPSREGLGVGSLSLKDFLHICATFASEPFVIILDQFEEFFQYQRYAGTFTPFIEQLSEVIRDRETPVAFLISMREDFALNLNAFKGYLPTTLFENYYRLEKLEIKEAEDAIRKPVEKIGFRYEEGLLQTLLKDLADQERESRIGSQKELIPENAPSFVEPPNVQIVCTQLWEEEKKNPDRIIHTKTYNEKGGSKGFINSYFKSVIAAFSPSEKKLASKAFDHLVTPRGTKMAYPVKDLSEKIREDENALNKILVKLEKARVLRSQDRKGVVWYELYHDIFSGIIYQWNNAYKTRQRTKRVLIGVGIAVAVLLLLFAAYDTVINLTSHHFHLSAKGISNQIELYRGKTKSWDFFNLQRYKAETPYTRGQLEPDKQFIEKPVGEYDDLDVELIGQLPIIKRISAYWDIGEIDRALVLAEKSISKDDITRTRSVIELLAGFQSQRAFEKLKKHLEDQKQDIYIRTTIISAIGSTQFTGATDSLISLLMEDSEVRSKVAKALGQLGSDKAIEFLIELLQDQESDVRYNALEALYQLSLDETTFTKLRESPSSELLIILLKKQAKEWIEGLGYTSYLQDTDRATKLLVRLNSGEAAMLLLELLQDQERLVRRATTQVLYLLSSDEAVFSHLRSDDTIQLLIKLLKAEMKEQIKEASLDPSWRGFDKATMLLVRLDSNEAIEQLIELMQDRNSSVRLRATMLLFQISINKTITEQIRKGDKFGLLVQLLKEQMERSDFSSYLSPYPGGSNSAAMLLVQIDKSEAVNHLLVLLEHQNSDVQSNAITMLSQLRFDDGVFEQVRESEKFGLLVQLLKEQMKKPGISSYPSPYPEGSPAAMLLAQLDRSEAVNQLLELLQERDPDGHRDTMAALYQLSSDGVVLEQIRKSDEFGLLVTLLTQQIKELLKAPVKETPLLPAYPVSSHPYQELLDQGLSEDFFPLESIHIPVMMLARFDNIKTIEVLFELLQDQQHADVRYNATAALYRLSNNRMLIDVFRKSDKFGLLVELLKGQMKKPIKFSRLMEFMDEATRLLVRLDLEEAIEQLLELLKDEHPYVRYRAASSLGQLGNDKAVEPLVKLLRDQDWSVRRSAAWALGQLDNSKTVEPLLELLQDQNWDVQYNACLTLGLFGSGETMRLLPALLHNQHWEVRGKAIATLDRLGSNEAAEQLRDLLKDETVPSVRASASLVLGHFDSNEAAESLIKLLQVTDPGISAMAIQILGQLGSHEAVEPLIELLNTQHFDIRYNVIEALGQIGDKRALVPLLQLLKDQEQAAYWSSDTQSRITRALGQLGSHEAVEALMKLLENRVKDVQFSAALALGKLSAQEAIDALKTLYNKESQIIAKSSFTGISPLYSMNETHVKLAVTAVLLSFDQDDGLEFLREKSQSEKVWERKGVAYVLGEIPSEQGKNILIAMLNDEDVDVKVQVVKSLTRTQASSLLSHLHLILLEDPNPKTRKVIVNALQEIASVESVDVLKQTVLNPEERVTIRISSINGLGKIGTEEAVFALLEILEKSSEHYHYQTIITLGKTRSEKALPGLLARLREQERRRARWRKIKDEDTRGYSNEQIEAWHKRFLEFELAHAIAQIDPKGEGVKLLSHDLAKVREGAWTGMARLPLTETRPFYLTDGPAAVALIERLDRERMQSKNPIFRHAAYQAIDGILITIEAYGGKPALKALEDFLERGVQDQEGVLTRVEWTIARLREREEKD